jgi:hypothetical protein
MMNFKKGSQLSKEKLESDNKKSLELLTTLPSQPVSNSLLDAEQVDEF